MRFLRGFSFLSRFSWYSKLVRPLLFLLPPERAQRVAEMALALRPAWRVVGLGMRVDDRVLHRTIAGLHLANPVGLAAGVDKGCSYLESLGHLGFGYVVGGTVTPTAQRGNPLLRLLRDPARQSLINAMGFPSEGLHTVAVRLRRLEDPPAPVLVSIAALDMEGFEECHRVLEPLVDGVELNISSPNTQGLLRFQEPEQLRELLERTNARRRKPVFVKLPPYVDEQGREHVLTLLRQCMDAGVAGVTASNTVPVAEPRLAVGRGGLSGRALFPGMLGIVSDLRKEAGTRLVINACGGISTGEEAWQALHAGADTVQLFTALVYQGPSVVRAMALGLAQRLRAEQAEGVSGQSMAERPR